MNRFDPQIRLMRPPLREQPLGNAWPPRVGDVMHFLPEGHWDALAAGAYAHGDSIVDLDETGRPIRVFRLHP